jgi:hypothetical protein
MIKYRIFGHPRLLMRGLSGARVEIGFGDDGIQPQAHHKRARRDQTNGSASSRLIDRRGGTHNPKF